MTSVLILVALVLIVLALAAWKARAAQRGSPKLGDGANEHRAGTPALLGPRQASTVDGPPRRFRLAAPDDSGDDLLGEVVEAEEALLFGSEEAGVVGFPIAWNGIAQAVPTIAGALTKNEVVRIIGPQHLIDGIQSGNFDLAGGPAGFTGLVKGPGGKFVGHLRFESAYEAAIPATIAGPLLLFQAASVVTMQYYLHQITSRLVDIQRGIDDIKRALAAQTTGQVRSAASIVDKLEPFATRGVLLSDDDRGRLRHAESQVGQAYETLKQQQAQFARQVHGTIADDGTLKPKVKTDHLKTLLSQGSEDAARDALLLAEAIAVRVRIARLQAFAEIDAHPGRHEVVRENLEREFEELRSTFSSLRGPFDRLNLRREAISSRRWAKSVDQELDDYRERTKKLRALLRTPVRRVLPPPTPEQPWLVELRQGSNGVESRYAVLEGTAEEVTA